MSDEGDHRAVRRDYAAETLSRDALPKDPLILFGRWLDQAIEAGTKDATAMALATADAAGVPSVRIVLLKEFNSNGFVWFTAYSSRKGQELAANPVASLAFYWRDFDHQVRINGPVSRIDAQTSNAYFQSRPVESRFSAAASQQSEPVADRQTLEARVQALHAKYPDDAVPMPDDWGGYRLAPERIEFWQGRDGRLHDRFLYARDRERGADGWLIERLQP